MTYKIRNIAAFLAGVCGFILTGCSSLQTSNTPAAVTSVSPATGSATPTQGADTASGYAFYQGKTLHIIVPYAPGGGYDQWARLLAPYLQKYLRLAKVEVVNTAGGGGLVGTNQIYSAKPDGLTLGDTNAGGDVFDQIAGASGMQFDVTRFAWIGRPDDDPQILAVQSKGAYTTFADVVHSPRPVKILAAGKGSADYNATVITCNVFHVPYTMVAAFSGSSDLKAAFVRGNGDACSVSSSDIKQIGNQARVVVIYSTRSSEKLPGVPTVIDVGKQWHLTQAQLDELTAMAGIMDLGHAFFAPPGVPVDRLAALRDAFKKAMNDPAFQAEASKAGLYLGYMPPEDLEQITQTALQHATELKPLLHEAAAEK
ncbi:MAG: hypothetical protein K6T26_04540 [Alicyclobacillus sp.]|nr:hypothetical protein [Alicyclobacillus sp.]